MAMAFSVVRRVFQKRADGIFIAWRSGCCNFAIECVNSCRGSKLGGHRNMSTSDPRMLPWLMLPPAFEGGDIVYSYYSFAEQKVVSIRGGGDGDGESRPAYDAEMVGSSHGWLALFNPRNSDLFLSNPLSHRHIRLPSIEILRDPEVSLRDGHVSVSKVILSSSPDEQGCRAIMTYAPAIGGSRLAFCSPGRSWRWTPIGDMYRRYGSYNCSYESVCEDLVYCSKMEVLTCMTQCEFDLESFRERTQCEIVNWDIGSPVLDDWNMGKPQVEDWDVARPPKEVWEIQEDVIQWREEKNKAYVNEQGNTWCWVVENMPLLKQQCIQIPHLVYDNDHSDQLFLVVRFVVLMGPDGSRLHRVPHCPIKGLSGLHRCQTVGFVVLRVNTNGVYEVVDDLNGLAMFVGMNHSFAISASDFPEFKPNSIYFTDANRLRLLHGVDDTGIFDYENKIISPVIITGHDHPIKSSPMWFYPLPEQCNAMCNK